MMRDIAEARLVWMDLEMTGLSEEDYILEMASLVTDCDLNLVAMGPHHVISQSDEILDAMGEWCQDQHGHSGLIQLVKDSDVSEEQAEAETLDFLSQHVKVGQAPLCGNSIGTDRRFLRRYMPKLESFFHYRQIDVSTIKLLAQYWSGGRCKYVSGSSSHRVIDDINQSINELQYYRQFMFNSVGAPQVDK